MGRRAQLPYRRAVLIGLTFISLASFGLNLLTVSSRTYAAEPARPDLSRPETSRSVRGIQPTDTLQLAELQNAFEAVAKEVAPCVVAISASISAVDADDVVRCDDLNAHKLNSVLDRVTRTVGTGFFIDPNGYLITNEHVVADAEQLWVTTDDRKVYPAIVVGTDPRSDLAILKVPVKNVPVARFARPGSVRRGQWSIALGNPYGLAGSGEMAMSVGVVSAMDRSLPKLSVKEDRNYSNLLQTTAEINPGNSGGPLFDLSGQVIGINAAVILPQKETSGIGFAFPVSQRLFDQIEALKEGREVVYGYLGVTVSTPTPSTRRSVGVPPDLGVSVDSVESNSPAFDLLRRDDMILSVNAQEIHDSDRFAHTIGVTPINRPVRIAVVREGKSMQLDVKLSRRPSTSVAVTRDTQRIRWRGLVLGPIPKAPDIAPFKQSKSGVPKSGVMVLNVAPTSPLSKQVTVGSIITSFAGKPVREIQDLQIVLNDTPAENCNIEVAGGSEPRVASSSD